MRKLYTPTEVAGWTASDIDTLVGKWVSVFTPASEAYRNDPLGGGDWEGGSGLVTAVKFNPANGHADVAWDWGMGWGWLLSDGSWVAVCDVHGEHYSPNAADCEDRFNEQVTGSVKR